MMASRSIVARHPGEIVVAAAVLAAVALVIVPVPPWGLDLLLSANLSLSVVVLAVTLFLESPKQLSSFPSLLLIAALFRVTLNVSTTRSILAHGEGGTVVAAFGSFVVQGNLAVGLVLFAIISVVQLVVVTRGAERVAEVGARFVLDGLPGQQMAIDADLRAGSIDAVRASERRAALQRETRFHGAMDGAMRFVKGDALASLIIVAICLVAGVAIGTLQRGMPIEGALKRYASLAIGDGLVTQIPSLLFAVSAAILATRTESEHGASSLGEDVSSQLLRGPRPLVASAVLLTLLAVIPGLPAIPFLVLAAVIGGLAYRRSRERTAERSGDLVTLNVRGEVSDEQIVAIETTARATLNRLGLPQHVEVARSQSPSATPMIEVINGATNLGTIDVSSGVEMPTRRALNVIAHELLSIDEVQRRLDVLSTREPVLVRSLVPGMLPVALVWQVLRELLRDGASIRELGPIVGALVRTAGDSRDPVDLSLRVRDEIPASRHVDLADDDGVIRVFELHPLLEEVLVSSLGTPGSKIAIPPGVARDVLDALRRGVETNVAEGGAARVLCRAWLRAPLRSIVMPEQPSIEVISTSELPREATIEIQGRLSPLDGFLTVTLPCPRCEARVALAHEHPKSAGFHVCVKNYART